MDSTIITILLIVFLALSFDFINGFHDTANSIATSISTKALPPRIAILLSASMNLLGALFFTGVAQTIVGGIADPARLEHGMFIVVAALISGIAWNLLTWYFGLPSSSSHALIGSLTGAVIAAGGYHAVYFNGLITIVKGLILSPLIAFLVGFIVMSLIRLIFRSAHPGKLNRRFRFLQTFAAAGQAFSHGTNDAQKSMGIITFALVAGGLQTELAVPFWVKCSCALAMALGTSCGGWKIIKTVGTQIIKLEPAGGFAADSSSALIIITATFFKLPVSTTHVISSAIMGVGAAKRLSAVKWQTAERIVVAWLITLPVTILFAGCIYLLICLFLNYLF